MRGVAMVVVLAGLLASCGAEGSVVSKTLAHRQKSGTARAVLQRLLDGDGIGGVTFGQAPEVVAARLRRLVGAPVGAQQIRNGYRHYFCSFYYEEWDGLGAASDGRFFVAGLDVLFSNSRFIGYSYGPNNLQTDLNTWNQYANQPLMLATAKGLAVGTRSRAASDSTVEPSY